MLFTSSPVGSFIPREDVKMTRYVHIRTQESATAKQGCKNVKQGNGLPKLQTLKSVTLLSWFSILSVLGGSLAGFYGLLQANLSESLLEQQPFFLVLKSIADREQVFWASCIFPSIHWSNPSSLCLPADVPVISCDGALQCCVVLRVGIGHFFLK